MTTIWTDELIDASQLTVVPNEVQDVLVSDTFQSPDSAMRIDLNYSELTPDETNVFKLSAIVEFEDNGMWRTLAHQFTPYFKAGISDQRIIIVQPDLLNLNPGSDEVVSVADDEVARISRSQGRVPKLTPIRLVIRLKDSDPTGQYGFDSVKVSASYDTYGV